MNATNFSDCCVTGRELRDIADVLASLIAVLKWLDDQNLTFPAIDVNNAIERLKPASNQHWQGF